MFFDNEQSVRAQPFLSLMTPPPTPLPRLEQRPRQVQLIIRDLAVESRENWAEQLRAIFVERGEDRL